MTPLIEKAVAAFAGWEGPWDAEAIGITSPQGMLAALSAVTPFVIDEAETDTTIARDLHPAYFATTSGFYLPAEVCWFEYKAYAPVGARLIDTGLRSAFMAMRDSTGGIVVFIVSEMLRAPGAIGIAPAFGFEPHMETGSEVMEGKAFTLRVPDKGVMRLSEEKASQGANFFMELVELVNMPAGVRLEREPASRAFRKRLARAMGRVDFTLAPVTHVSLDLPDLYGRATRATA